MTMRRISSLVLLGALLVMPARAGAQTSIDSLLGLKTAGFSDDLLIATFQSDGTVYHLTAEDLIFLRQQGISERVLIAMLETRRPPAAVPVAGSVALAPAPPQPAQVVPPVVEVTQHVEQRVEVEAPRQTPRTIYVPVPVTYVPRDPQPKVDPVYWGYGGRPRPSRVPTSSSSGGETKPGGGGR